MPNGMAQLEGAAEVPGGKVWFKRVGGGVGFPLLAVHGGPGFPHNYLRSLERLANERAVIFWDQLGCGNSERPSNVQLWNLERSVVEVGAVIDALGLDQFHLFGNSWGGMLAQQYVLDSPPRAVSLVISNSVASIAKLADNATRLKSRLDIATQVAIDHHKAAGTTDSTQYHAAVRVWSENYFCRVLPWPEELKESFNNAGREIYKTMIGGSDFHVTGNLRNWDVLGRLGEIAMPTLVVAGSFDECPPEHMWEMHQRIPGSQFELFDASAHMPFIEEPERFDEVMRAFLRSHDARM